MSVTRRDREAVGGFDARVLRLLAHLVEVELALLLCATVGAAVVAGGGGGGVVRAGVVIVAACRCEQPEGEQRGREAK